MAVAVNNGSQGVTVRRQPEPVQLGNVGGVGWKGPLRPPQDVERWERRIHPLIRIARTITGPPGAPARVANLGTPHSPFLAFSIPQGRTGPSGMRGFPGPAGPPGLNPQGEVASFGDLPTDPAVGDLWLVHDTGVAWVWYASGEWVPLGQITGPPGTPGLQGPPGPAGAPGAPGQGITIAGVVDTLPATGGPGQIYVVSSTGHGWIWTQPSGPWVDLGAIMGAPGPAGPQGPPGPAASFQALTPIQINSGTSPPTLSLISPLPIANGGTGASNAASARQNLGAQPVGSYLTAAVTQVTAGTGLVTNPLGGITGTGSVALSTPVSIANGGTGASDAATARANLGIASTAVTQVLPNTGQFMFVQNDSVLRANPQIYATTFGTGYQWLQIESYDNTNCSYLALYRARGTRTAPAAVLNGDKISSIVMGGAPQGSATLWPAEINCDATQNWTTTARGCNLFFNYTANGSIAQSVGLQLPIPNIVTASSTWMGGWPLLVGWDDNGTNFGGPGISSAQWQNGLLFTWGGSGLGLVNTGTGPSGGVAGYVMCMGARGTMQSPQATQNNDTLAQYMGFGYNGAANGTGWTEGTSWTTGLKMYAAQNWTPNANGSQVQIVTCQQNSVTNTNLFNFNMDGSAAKSSGAGQWAGTSDARMKKNVRPYARGLSEILALKPIEFQWNGYGGSNDNGAVHQGLIAQDVLNVMPEMIGTQMVHWDPNDKIDYAGAHERREAPPGLPLDTEVYTLDPTAIQYALVNAVKEIVRRLEALEN